MFLLQPKKSSKVAISSWILNCLNLALIYQPYAEKKTLDVFRLGAKNERCSILCIAGIEHKGTGSLSEVLAQNQHRSIASRLEAIALRLVAQNPHAVPFFPNKPSAPLHTHCSKGPSRGGQWKGLGECNPCAGETAKHP